jgi:23S rRNA pseudouridine1911/1915/1917 synthase
MSSHASHEIEAPASDAGQRLDFWLSRQRPEHSRARWQALIKEGRVTVQGAAVKPNHTLRAGDRVAWTVPPPVSTELRAEDIPLRMLFEDGDLLVLNKPAGLVVHPAAGHESGTLVNALLHHCPDLGGIGGERRPGIVHRLDRGTTGVMVVAKNEPTLAGLARQFKAHEVTKEYLALVWGRPRPPHGTINIPIGRHPQHRKKMSALPRSSPGRAGRPAVTHYAVVEEIGDACLCRIGIETGRTHQIRVHLSHLGHPVVGDRQYGRGRKADAALPATRQMLHAYRLAFQHPRTRQPLEFIAPMPADMQAAIKALRTKGPPATDP